MNASKQSAEARTCPSCHKGAAMNRVNPKDPVHRRCRYCGYEDSVGCWRKRKTPHTIRSARSGHRVTPRRGSVLAP